MRYRILRRRAGIVQTFDFLNAASLGSPPFRSQAVDRPAASNCDQPGHRSAARWIKTCRVGPHAQIYFLKQIFGRLSITYDGQNDTHGFGRRSRVERLERLGIF